MKYNPLSSLLTPSPSEPTAQSGSSDSNPGGVASPEKTSAPRSSERLKGRHLGEVCPEVMLIMPFTVPLLLTMRLRKWLRCRVGRKAGNILGKAAIIAFGGPPLLLAFVSVLLLRVVFMVISKLEQAARAWRGA